MSRREMVDQVLALLDDPDGSLVGKDGRGKLYHSKVYGELLASVEKPERLTLGVIVRFCYLAGALDMMENNSVADAECKPAPAVDVVDLPF